ncbi:MAG: MFS transporter, partial [bacterium]|nr:MFS transporter [bacterium]
MAEARLGDRVEGPGPSAPGREAPPSPQPEGRIDYKWLATAVVIVGGFMVILDQTVVNVALPVLESDFHTSLTSIQWVVTGYALALAAVIPLSGWLSDRFGTKRIFLVSQISFVVGSVLCGLAWSEQALIVFRLIQGLGGGLVMPVGMTILMRVTKPEERGRIMSMLGVPMMLAPVLGPTLGGWLVQAESWRLIFYINVPVGIVGALLCAFSLRPDRQTGPRHALDVGG